MIKSLLSTNACFSTSFNNKSKAWGWNDAKCLFLVIYVILNVKHQKIPIYRGCNLIVVHCWWRHKPTATPKFIKFKLIFLKRSKVFHWKQNRFEILQHIKNSGEGFHQFPPPPPPCTTVGVWIACTSKGKNYKKKKKTVRIGLQCGDYLFQSASRTLLANCNVLIVTLLYWAHHVINRFSPSHLTVLDLWFQTPPFPHWVDEGPLSR